MRHRPPQPRRKTLGSMWIVLSVMVLASEVCWMVHEKGLLLDMLAIWIWRHGLRLRTGMTRASWLACSAAVLYASWGAFLFAQGLRAGSFAYGSFEADRLIVLMVVTVFSVFLLTAEVKAIRTADEPGAVLCARCGYDLRHSSERCPECGTLISPAVNVAALAEALGEARPPRDDVADA